MMKNFFIVLISVVLARTFELESKITYGGKIFTLMKSKIVQPTRIIDLPELNLIGEAVHVPIMTTGIYFVNSDLDDCFLVKIRVDATRISWNTCVLKLIEKLTLNDAPGCTKLLRGEMGLYVGELESLIGREFPQVVDRGNSFLIHVCSSRMSITFEEVHLTTIEINNKIRCNVNKVFT